MKLSILLFALLFSLAQPPGNSDSDLFVVVTTGDAETQMMAMVLATQSLNQEVNVRVLLCSDAGELAVSGSDSPALAPANRSPKQLLSGLIDRGTVVEVCGIFLPNRDYTQEDLMDGVGSASPPEVAQFINREEVKLFTF